MSCRRSAQKANDHSRLCVAAQVFTITKATDVVDVFRHAATTWGYPASVLSDNGAVFTAAYRNGIGAMESELCALGITFKHSRPYHPQTCGKVERFHQTVKKFLAKQDPAPTTPGALQALKFPRFSGHLAFAARPHEGSPYACSAPAGVPSASGRACSRGR